VEKWAELWRGIDERLDVYEYFSLPSLAKQYFKSMVALTGAMNFVGVWGHSSKISFQVEG
jgi:hypothetical protein